MCGPRFCSMKITQEIQTAAEAGMLDKAREFRDKGWEIYLPEPWKAEFVGHLASHFSHLR